MAENLYTHQAANIRKTWFLMTGFLLVVIAIGWLFSQVWGSPAILYGANLPINQFGGLDTDSDPAYVKDGMTPDAESVNTDEISGLSPRILKNFSRTFFS